MDDKQRPRKDRRPSFEELPTTGVPTNLSRSGKRLSAAAYRILGNLLSYNPTYPSMKRVVFETGLSRETVYYGLYELTTVKGILRMKSRGGPRGHNRYWLAPECEWTLTGEVLSRKEWREMVKKKKSRHETSKGLVARPRDGLATRREVDQSQSDQLTLSGRTALSPTRKAEIAAMKEKLRLKTLSSDRKPPADG